MWLAPANEAIENLVSLKPDVFVSDLSMLYRAGFGLIRGIVRFSRSELASIPAWLFPHSFGITTERQRCRRGTTSTWPSPSPGVLIRCMSKQRRTIDLKRQALRS